MSASHESYVKWIQIGKDLGYDGVDLTAFVKERTDEDRDHRIAERELKKAELENAEKIKQQELEAAYKRQEIESLQRQQERDALAKEKENERQFELNKLKLIKDQELAEKRVQHEAERVQADFTLRQQELEIRRQNSETQSSNVERYDRENEFRSFNLSLPKFDNNGTNLQGFLTRFEKLATVMFGVWNCPNVWTVFH